MGVCLLKRVRAIEARRWQHVGIEAGLVDAQDRFGAPTRFAGERIAREPLAGGRTRRSEDGGSEGCQARAGLCTTLSCTWTRSSG